MARRVAFIAPLSGGEGVVAGPMLEAAQRGAGELAVEALDDHRDPDEAAALVERLAADERVIGVVGPKNSGSAAGAAPLAAAGGLPLLLPAATADDLCVPGGTVFRLCARDRETAAAAVRLCAALGVTRLAVQADGTAYGYNLAAAVTAAAGELLAGLGQAQAIFHAMGEVEQAEAIRAIRADGFDGLLLGAEGGPGAPLAELAGPAGEGAYQLYPGAAAPGATAVYAAEAEDAARALAASAGPDRAATLANLRTLDLPGVSGRLAFDALGERRAVQVTVWRLLGGRAVPVEGWDGAGHAGGDQPARSGLG